MGNEVDLVKPDKGIKILCSHCGKTAMYVLNGYVTTTHRHNGKYHKTVISLAELIKASEKTVKNGV